MPKPRLSGWEFIPGPAKKSSSRPERHEAHGTLVMELKRTMPIPKRGHGIEGKIAASSPPEVRVRAALTAARG